MYKAIHPWMEKLIERSNMYKQFYKSKTVWFNVITIGLGIMGVFNQTYPIDPQTMAFIVGIGNLILRLISEEKIAFGKRNLFGKKI